jgi:hypothetical protein
MNQSVNNIVQITFIKCRLIKLHFLSEIPLFGFVNCYIRL